MDLSTLLGQGTVNPLDLLDRVFRQVVEELARSADVAALGDSPPEELLVTALGNRLAHMVLDDRSAGSTEWRSASKGHDELVDELVDRNLALAAALGACDCWGQDPACRVCEGLGAPGWLPPDPQLFAAYVYPAMRAIKREARSPGASTQPTQQNHNTRKETEDVRHHAR